MDGSVPKKPSFFVVLIGSSNDKLLWMLTGLVIEAASLTFSPRVICGIISA